MMRRAAPMLLGALLCAGAAPSSTVPPELRKAAALAESDHRGIIGFQIRWDTEADGGPFHQRFHYLNAYAYDGDRFLGARAIEKVDNGHHAGQAELDAETKRIAQNERGSGTGFAVPFDSRHFSEYHFTRAACDALCLEGDTAVSFTSDIQDVNHGDGRMIIDRDGHVRRMEYAPKVKPAFGRVHAREAQVSIERAAVLPGFWATVKIESRFSGRYGFISGSAKQTTQYERYRRFRTDDAALAALQSGTI